MGDFDEEPLERVLARIVRLGSVSKHPQADRLQIGEVGGWKTVVGHAAKEGDLGVYFEVDSCLPEADWVAALGLPRMKMNGNRPIITTKKIRGQLSQGLFLIMDQVGLSCSTPEDEEKWLAASDVTEMLGVSKKPEPKDIIPVKPVKAGGQRTLFGEVFIGGHGPSKTDELRVQSYMHLLDQLQGLPYYITLKVDGTSVTYGYDKNWDGLIVCSRNYMLSKEDRDDTVYEVVAKQYNMEEILSKHPNLVIQAEIYGSDIQKNLLGQRGLKLAVFTIYDKDRRGFLTFEELQQTCSDLGLPMVPVEEVGQSFNHTMAQLLEKAKGFYPKTKNHREGLVVRSQLLADTSKSHPMPISFKVINNDFLLAQDK